MEAGERQAALASTQLFLHYTPPSSSFNKIGSEGQELLNNLKKLKKEFFITPWWWDDSDGLSSTKIMAQKIEDRLLWQRKEKYSLMAVHAVASMLT